MDNDPLFKDAQKKDYKPQPLKPDEKVQTAPSKTQLSAWNTKGTWEERKVKVEDLLAYMKAGIDQKGLFTDSLDFEVLSVESAEGECSTVSVRGK